MEKMKNVAKGVAKGAGKVGGAYVERSKRLYDHYNKDPLTGEHLCSKKILKNHRYFIGGHACWYLGAAFVGGSFLPSLLGKDDPANLESYLQVGGFSLMSFGAFLSSIFYSRTNDFRSLKDSFIESPGRTTAKLAEGFADAQIVAPTYKAMLIGKLTEGPRKTANSFGGNFTEKFVDPLCLSILDYIGSKGKIGRGLENLVVKGSEVCYGIYH